MALNRVISIIDNNNLYDLVVKAMVNAKFRALNNLITSGQENEAIICLTVGKCMCEVLTSIVSISPPINMNELICVSELNLALSDSYDYLISDQVKASPIIVAYALTQKLVKLNVDVFSMISTITYSEQLNLNILSSTQVKSLKLVLRTKKTIYVKILLVLAFELVRLPPLFSHYNEYLGHFMSIESIDELKTICTNPVVETYLHIFNAIKS